MIRFNIPFLRYRRFAYIISALIIAGGLISFSLHGLNLGIDFTGGTILHLRLPEQYNMQEVREVLSPHELEGVPLQRAGGDMTEEGSEVVVKAPYLEESTRQEVIGAFQERWPDITTEDVLRVENVGAVIGEELTREAFLALLLAIAGMVLYITLRFQFRFSLAAIAALLHDVLIVLAIFSIFQIEINSPFIAAILTVFGYSINDTIVIFDRIRENLRFRQKRTLVQLVNDSINENIVRSINTSLTTLIVLISLFIAFHYFVGGMDLQAFALALLAGVVSGTYSSIFIAGPLWVSMNQRRKEGEISPA